MLLYFLLVLCFLLNQRLLLLPKRPSVQLCLECQYFQLVLQNLWNQHFLWNPDFLVNQSALWNLLALADLYIQPRRLLNLVSQLDLLNQLSLWNQ